ncbi:unnamed protein product [Bursaphelenchus okinawaensis]|uniref:Saposin B-type domain-containing protein n=1 Tax=Bursaphelenchus okinawaensis TaxID=465554 RepID=A0A811K9E7_9BILA|nr:unnamed protein product [Bursaphelenchus okinawaensis]CAG9097229.1 unnamed protein product [Bursaphelenchus okinawaensis]
MLLKTITMSLLLYLTIFSHGVHAGIVDFFSDIWSSIVGVETEVSSASELANTIVNNTEDEVKSAVKTVPLLPEIEGLGVLCTPCTWGIDFVSSYITDNVYVPIGLATVCPIIYTFDNSANNLLACEIVVAGAVVFSYFGNSEKVCKQVGFCGIPAISNLFKSKRQVVYDATTTPLGLDDILSLMPTDLHDFSQKLTKLSPANYIEVEKTVIHMVSQIREMNPHKLLDSLNKIAPYYT